jgi:hypothetical protein
VEGEAAETGTATPAKGTESETSRRTKATIAVLTVTPVSLKISPTELTITILIGNVIYLFS